MSRKLFTAVSFIVAWTFLVLGPASSEESLGLWCLELLPGIPESNELINIIQKDSGSFEAQRTSPDGTSFTQDLREVGPGVFSIVDFEQSSGDRFEILPGVLVVLDNQGLIAAGDKMMTNEGIMECLGK